MHNESWRFDKKYKTTSSAVMAADKFKCSLKVNRITCHKLFSALLCQDQHIGTIVNTRCIQREIRLLILQLQFKFAQVLAPKLATFQNTERSQPDIINESLCPEV